MTPDEYRFLYELEEHHWWFVGMRKIVAALLDGKVSKVGTRILDAGCGTGLMLSWLRRYGNPAAVYGLDYDARALGFCAARGEKRIAQGTLASTPFSAGAFDLVTSFDVLDSFPVRAASAPFGELARVLKPGGVLLVRVPAFQFLFSQHDRAVYTRHRYTAGELRARLQEHGLKVVRVTYANTFLFPIVLVWRWLTRSERPNPQSDVRPLSMALRRLNPVLAGLFAIEAAWLRLTPWRLPYGASVLAMATKPPSPREG